METATMTSAARRRFTTLGLALGAGALLSACGFRLRGSDGSAMLPYKTIYLGSLNGTPFGTELRRNIESTGGTKVVTDAKLAEASLDVLNNIRRKDILTLNSAGRVREFTLIQQLNFQVRDAKGAVVLQPTQILLRRTMSYDENLALAKEAEEQTLYKEMQSDMVQQIMRRVGAIKPAA